MRFKNIVQSDNGLAYFNGENISFTVEGHSTKGKGKDIYCAGISAIVQACIAALTKIGAIFEKFEQRDGFLLLSLKIAKDSPIRKEVRTIIGVLMTGVQLMKALPGSQVEIFFDEV
ncbi:MAG: ribosomal-processing cysteine protease Prp [Spirochaetes bacterium]|nr:ribosomal-processing cysteine protease Prp [Spirochaetota bacterium]